MREAPAELCFSTPGDIYFEYLTQSLLLVSCSPFISMLERFKDDVSSTGCAVQQLQTEEERRNDGIPPMCFLVLLTNHGPRLGSQASLDPTL